MAPSKKIDASTFIIRFICGFLLGILAGLYASITVANSFIVLGLIVLAFGTATGLMAALFGDRFWHWVAHSRSWF